MRHLQILAEQAAGERRQEAEQRARFDHARARHVGDDDAALAQHVDQPGDAELRRGVEFERIEQVEDDQVIAAETQPLQRGGNPLGLLIEI